MNLIYVGDAMCSWCYGFAQPLDALLADPQDAAPLRLSLVMGGLRPFTTDAIAPERADELAGHWHRVAEASGQPFAQTPHTALHLPGFVYDTEPAARATVTVRSLFPQHVWRYFKAVQHAFYAGLGACPSSRLQRTCAPQPPACPSRCHPTRQRR